MSVQKCVKIKTFFYITSLPNFQADPIEDEDDTIQCILYYTLYYENSGYTCTIANRQTI